MDQTIDTLVTLSSDSKEREPLLINDSSQLAITPATGCHLQSPKVVFFIIVASIPALLVGCIVGFPSAALLDLQELEIRPQYKFGTALSDVFAVSKPLMLWRGGVDQKI